MVRLASNSAVYGVAGILNRFASLLLLPFFTEALTTADYGVISLIGLVTTALIGIFNLGTANSIGLLYFSKTDFRSRCQVIWTGTIFLALNCVAFLTLVWWTSSQISHVVFGVKGYAPLIQLAFLSMICSVIADPFLAHLRMNNKATAYVSLTLLSFTLTSGLSVWFVLFEKVGVIGVFHAQVFGQAFLLLLSLLLIGRQLIFTFDWRLIRPLVAIGFPSVIGSFATLFLTYSDRWLIEYFLGLGQLGVYSVGISFGMFIAVLVGAFDTAWPPFFSSYLNRREEAKRVFSLVFTYFVFGFGIVSLVVFIVAKPVVSHLTAVPFHDAWMVVGFVGFSQVLYGAFSVLGTGIYFSRKLGYISLFKWIAASINIILNVILIPILDIIGAALSMVIGYLSLALMTYYMSRIEFPIDYEWQRISKFVGLFFLSVILQWFFNITFDMAIGFILNIVVFALFMLYLWSRILSFGERNFIASFVYSLKNK
jgi:O-antigen/teichoic acid export membrane protein